MERGLLWLPLLAAFITLTWLGWRSYRQVEAYRSWAADFDTAKYDPAAVAALKASILFWGNPTTNGPQNVQSIDLAAVDSIELVVDGKAIAWPPEDIPQGKTFQLELVPLRQSVPFTDGKLAIAWCRKLRHIVSGERSENAPAATESQPPTATRD